MSIKARWIVLLTTGSLLTKISSTANDSMDRKDSKELQIQPEVTAVDHVENGLDSSLDTIDEKEPFTWQQVGGVIVSRF